MVALHTAIYAIGCSRLAHGARPPISDADQSWPLRMWVLTTWSTSAACGPRRRWEYRVIHSKGGAGGPDRASEWSTEASSCRSRQQQRGRRRRHCFRRPGRSAWLHIPQAHARDWARIAVPIALCEGAPHGLGWRSGNDGPPRELRVQRRARLCGRPRGGCCGRPSTREPRSGARAPTDPGSGGARPRPRQLRGEGDAAGFAGAAARRRS